MPSTVQDATDRTLLGLLLKNADTPYKELAARLSLSAAAVHERVKRLKRAGVIRNTTLNLDPVKTGRPLLAFVHVDTTGWGKSESMMQILDDDRVEEMHAVAGDTCMILKVRCEGTSALETLLHRIYDVPGVKGTQSYIVLSTQAERGVGVTAGP